MTLAADMRTREKQIGSTAKRRTCMLVITHQCNLNCRYCYESFKSRKAMPFDLAKKSWRESLPRRTATKGCRSISSAASPWSVRVDA